MDPADMNRTMPMQAIPHARALMSDSQGHTTQMEIPQQPYGKDSEFELAGLDDDDDDAGTNTSVLTFEDDDKESAPTVAVPLVSGAAAKSAPAQKAAQKKKPVVEEEEEFVEESFDDDDGFDDEEFEGDELDAHDAEDFEDDDFSAGQSQVGGFPARVAARPDVDWGIGLKIMLGLSTVLSLLCAVIGVELVRTMWLWTQPGQTVEKSGILEMLGGLF
jgi:hypothetical protein